MPTLYLSPHLVALKSSHPKKGWCFWQSEFDLSTAVNNNNQTKPVRKRTHFGWVSRYSSEQWRTTMMPKKLYQIWQIRCRCFEKRFLIRGDSNASFSLTLPMLGQNAIGNVNKLTFMHVFQFVSSSRLLIHWEASNSYLEEKKSGIPREVYYYLYLYWTTTTKSQKQQQQQASRKVSVVLSCEQKKSLSHSGRR